MKQIWQRQNRWKTLLILVLDVAFIRLGIWQLDRLDERRAANALLAQRVTAPALRVNDLSPDSAWSDLINRPATAQGVFDLDHQVAVQYQTYQERPGVILAAPLRLSGSERAILVNRGWLPLEQADPAQWAAYAVSGTVTLTGYLQAAGSPEAVGLVTPGSAPAQRDVLRLNVAELQAQIPYPILPVFLLEAPPPSTPTALPARLPLELDLSEGPHLSYALQWFAFAIIFGGGYWAYLRRPARSAPD